MIFSDTFNKLSKILTKIQDAEERAKRLRDEVEVQLTVLREKEKSLNKIISEKTLAFPWLAEAIGEFYRCKYDEIAKFLENKSHPGMRSADEVRALAITNKSLNTQLFWAKHCVNYYESLFPWLRDYIGEGLDDVLIEIRGGVEQSQNDGDIVPDDPVKKYMLEGEYLSLSPAQRNQLALDRYLAKRHRSNYLIGRDYERYVGFLFEYKGYEVEYYGILNGFQDLGRDLICKRDNEVVIVQCKCWSEHKQIHENHINQLFGTTIMYCLENEGEIIPPPLIKRTPNPFQTKKISATLVTATTISEKARDFARALNIELVEGCKLRDYPIIKCNISASGERIYHLPFDQQYDRTKIKNEGEKYVSTVAKAESLGFKRALRWRGGGDNQTTRPIAPSSP